VVASMTRAQARAAAELELRRRRAIRAVDPAPALSPLAWATEHRRIDDLPFSLERFRPLRAIYEDDHRHIVVIKPAQVGVSEMAVTRACHALDVGARYWQTGKNGLNVGYLFPTQQALGDFSKERISSIKRESAYLAALFTGDFDDVTFKQVRDSYLYLRGAWSESALLSFAADVLILDEFDRMDPAAVNLARKRLRQSMVKREIDISTPTLPGRGIHAEYLQSDQRVWEVRCDDCRRWSELDFFRDVRANGAEWETWRYWDTEQVRSATFTVTCPACRGELDRLGEGRWRATHPEVTGIRGYHVPALSFPAISLVELAVLAIDPDPTVQTEFHRSDLGRPYEPAGARVTDDMLQQLSHELPAGVLPPAMAWHNTTMGVDVGARWHYRVSSTGTDGTRYVRAMGSVRSWEALDEVMATFRVRQCVIDAMPELKGAEDWAARHPGKVLRAFYPTGASALQGKLFHLKAEEGVVQVNRTTAMDAVFTIIAHGRERWPAAIHRDPEVVAHLKAPVRVTTLDKHGQEQVSWVHTAPDHFFHASVYDLIAQQVLPEQRLSGLGLAGLQALQGSAKGWGLS
jgi:hypothetical protein